MKKYIPFLLFSIFIVSCSNPEPSKKDQSAKKEVEIEEAHAFASATEQVHQKELFSTHDSLVFDLQLYFGGNERLIGELALATNSTGGKITYENGNFISYGSDGISHSDEIKPESARFSAYTWSYFALMPFKLTDPGTNWETIALDFHNGTVANKLTFGENIGDAPDDWYILTTNSEGLLHEAAYIVTARSTVEEAESDPHAIRYENYKSINGIPVAHDWTFFAWNEQVGSSDTLGYAKLSNIRFK
ncbi:MAG: hypothetical protein ACPGED_06585 [Flavobacteriales bacterium]